MGAAAARIQGELEHGRARLRVLEFHCGIGGCAAALPPGADVIAAIDINRSALAVYSLNFAHPTLAVTIESLSRERIERFAADLWWMSPPCQPHTIRGAQKDLDDPRSASFIALCARIAEIRPRLLAMENVPPFGQSASRDRLVEVLNTNGYEVREHILCPTELGVPARRRRYYLIAAREGGLRPHPPRPSTRLPLEKFLDARANEDESLVVSKALTDKYTGALDIVSAEDPQTVCACFTSAYGRSPVRSGSYLRLPDGRLRRFSPCEILGLYGFPASWRLPSDMRHDEAWRLVGNSLSVDAVRWVLGALP